MKSHSRSNGLPGRPAPLPPAQLGLCVVQEPQSANLDSRFSNHESQIALYSSPVAQRRRILIASLPLLEFRLTRSQQKRKHFLIASFSAVLAFEGCGARGNSRLLNRGLRNYGTRTGRRDFKITKVSAPTISAASIQYLAWLSLKRKGVAMMAIAQTSDQTILEVGLMQQTLAPQRLFPQDY
jgi:hypothetical protein